MSVPQLALFGVFGVGNLGNDSTLEAMLHHIRKYQPTAAITCVCGNPRGVSEQFGIPTLPFDIADASRAHEPASRALRTAMQVAARGTAEGNFWLRQSSWLRQIGQFIVVGTGVLDDFGVRPWNLPYDLFKWCTAARRAGCKVVFLSVGVGPIENRVSRTLMLGALRQATYRSYRDVVSLEYLHSVGFNAAGDGVYPDLVFSLPEKEWNAPATVTGKPQTIGLGVMGYYGWRNLPGYGEAIYQGYLTKMKSFLAWLLDQGFAVRLLTGEIPTDERPVEDLLAFVETEGRADWQDRILAEPITDVHDLLQQIATTDLVVATRFHNILCALMAGRPVVSIGYSKKNDALMLEMGLQAYCQHVERFTVDELIQQFQFLISEFGQAAVRIQHKRSQYREMLDGQYRTILCGETVRAAGA